MKEWEARLARPREQFTEDIQAWSQSCGTQSSLCIRITWGVKTLLSGGCTPDQLNPSLWRWEPDISSFKSSQWFQCSQGWGPWRVQESLHGKWGMWPNKRAATVRFVCAILSCLIKGACKITSSIYSSTFALCCLPVEGYRMVCELQGREETRGKGGR